MRLRYSLKSCVLLTVVLSIGLGWYSHQSSRYRRELAASRWLVSERGADLGWFTWDDPLPLTLEFDNGLDYEGGEVPAWSWSELTRGKLYRPVNWCRIDYIILGDHISRAKIDSKCVNALMDLTELEHLYIEATGEFKDSQIPYDRLSKLEFLEVSEAPLSEAEVTSISRIPYLKSLILGDELLDDNDVLQVSRLRNLRRLNIYSPLLTDKSLEWIGRLHLLQDLALEGASITDSGLINLHDMQFLSKLYLGKTSVTGTGFKPLSGLPISKIDLAHSRITDEGLAVIVRALPGITELGLRYTDITNEGIALLATTLPNLSDLNVCGTNITDDCISSLKSMKSLKNLYIVNAGLSDKALSILEGIEGCRVLR